MSTMETTTAQVPEPIPDDGRAGKRRSRRLPQVGLILAIVVLGIIVIAAITGPALAPHSPRAQDLANIMGAPSPTHLLGTDHLGRDVLSRIILGARPALIGVSTALAVACALGIPWGLLAGYYGGAVDSILMRIADAILVYPALILAIVITGALGTGVVSSMTALGVAFSPNLARIVRSGVIAEVHRDYVQITRMFGCSSSWRLWRHILPNSFEPMLVQVTIYAGVALLAQSGLDFLGLGVQIPNASWGADLSQAFSFILVAPAATFAPGMTIAICVLALYRVGDALRDRL